MSRSCSWFKNQIFALFHKAKPKLFIWIGIMVSLLPLVGDEPILPSLFTRSKNHLVYFHSHTASPKELEKAAATCSIFEIDLAWAYSQFNHLVVEGAPYIGHPEEFYTEMDHPFPTENVTLSEFKKFLADNPFVNVLIDIKDASTFSYLKEFIKTVGVDRCIVHAFIKNWTLVSFEASIEPHWYREDIDLFDLDEILAPLKVPLIANCRGFNDQNVKENGLLLKMIEDAKTCRSVVSLGLYYPGAPLPDCEFLKLINNAGYYAWVNGNVSHFEKRVCGIKYIAMSDIPFVIQESGFQLSRKPDS